MAESLDRLDSILRTQHANVKTPTAWPVAIGHAPWIIQVWVNYISNAAKYGGTPPHITLGADTPLGGDVKAFAEELEKTRLMIERKAR